MSDEEVKKQNEIRKKAIEIEISRQVKQQKEREEKGKQS